MRGLLCPLCDSSDVKSKRKVGRSTYVVCQRCSLAFTFPYPEDKHLFDDYYWTREYTDNFERYKNPVLHSFKKKIQIVEQLLQRKTRSFLDVGCGNGLYLYAADSFGITNLGIDVDKKNIDFAREKGLNAVAVPIQELETSDRFDFIHLKSVLHLVKYPKTMIEASKRLLAPDGLLYIEVPNQGSLFSLLRKYWDRHNYGQLQPPFRNRAYTFKSLKYLCRESGLSIRHRDFPYLGDKVYYPRLHTHPLKSFDFYKALIFCLFSRLHISSLIGIYTGHTHPTDFQEISEVNTQVTERKD